MPFGVRRFPDNCDPRTPCFAASHTENGVFPRAWKYLLKCWGVREISTDTRFPLDDILFTSTVPGTELRFANWEPAAAIFISEFEPGWQVELELRKETSHLPLTFEDDMNLYVSVDSGPEILWARIPDLLLDPYQSGDLQLFQQVALDGDHELILDDAGGECAGLSATMEPRPWDFLLAMPPNDAKIDVEFDGPPPWSGMGGEWFTPAAATQPTEEGTHIHFDGEDNQLGLVSPMSFPVEHTSFTHLLTLRTAVVPQFSATTLQIYEQVGDDERYAFRATDATDRVRTKIDGLLQSLDGPVPVSTWNNFWIRYDAPAGRVRWMLGDVEIDDAPAPVGHDITLTDSTNWYLGATFDLLIPWEGDIRRFMYWDRLLTLSEIAAVNIDRPPE